MQSIIVAEAAEVLQAITKLTWCMQKVKTGIQYIIAQCVGGVLGAYAAFNLLPGKSAFGIRPMGQELKAKLMIMHVII